jgi:PhnB protein
MHYGDRRAMIEDPQGNTWQIATHFQDVSPEEIARRLKAPP